MHIIKGTRGHLISTSVWDQRSPYKYINIGPEVTLYIQSSIGDQRSPEIYINRGTRGHLILYISRGISADLICAFLGDKRLSYMYINMGPEVTLYIKSSLIYPDASVPSQFVRICEASRYLNHQNN